MSVQDFKQKLEQLKYELTEKPKDMLTRQAKNKLLGLEEEEQKSEKVDGRNLKKLTTITSGAYYSKDGYFIGKVDNAENAFIVDTERGSLISDIVNYRNANLKEELAKYDIYGTELSNRDLMIFATICIREESTGDNMGTAAVANAFINYLLGGASQYHNLEYFVKTKGYSSVDASERIPVDYTKIQVGSREQRAVTGVCNALLYYGDIRGAKDYSNGATHWDGFDFAARGATHPKGTDQGYHIVSEQHKDDYSDFWTLDKIKTYGSYTSKATLTTIPVVASGAYNKGRILYKSVAQYGGTIFWGPNYGIKENEGYDWKYYFKG